MRRTAQQFREMREDALLMKEMAEMPPSQFAVAIVAKRPEIPTKATLRQLAKEMEIPVNQLAADIIARRNLPETETAITDANSVSPEMDYSPATETIGNSQFEAGQTIIEDRQRREMVIAYNRKLRSRSVYSYARELLESIGREYGAVVSALPNGTVNVYAVKREVNAFTAKELQTIALDALEAGTARIAAAELAISKVPLNSNPNNIPIELRRERDKAMDAMKVIRARVERANRRVADSESITADKKRLELVATLDVDSQLPGATAIATWKLPNAIIQRPFRETLRPSSTFSSYSPVEQEVINRETEMINAVIRAIVATAILEAKSEQIKADNEQKRSVKNAEYKNNQAIAARARRARNKK